MLAKYMIDKYKIDVILTLNSVNNDAERNELSTLLKLLELNEYVIRAMTDVFNIEDAPERVYLFDLKRNMFWNGVHGYTSDFFSAGIFDVSIAKKIVEDDYTNNTKIVYFD